MGVKLSPGDTELVRTLSQFLGEFAAEGKLDHADEHGVDVLYNREEDRAVRFRFVTFDDLEVTVDVRLSDVDQAYMDAMFDDLLAEIERRRRARQGTAGAIRELSQGSH